MTRYEEETKMLSYLAKRQLNLNKNKIKCSFEEMSPQDILIKLIEEIGELIQEFKHDSIDYSLATLEIGDCAAVLTGLLAYVNNKHKELNK
jgi:NTP pyrophosphatase (non-canonical NTP hydrolase)